MPKSTELLTIKAELFHRKTTRERMRKIALDLCDRLEVAEGAAMIRSVTQKPK